VSTLTAIVLAPMVGGTLGAMAVAYLSAAADRRGGEL
jgi:hypothetical protein